MDLYPHQIDALEKVHNGCILRAEPGVGKSRVAMAYYKAQEAPRDVYIITTAKKRDSLDWEAEGALVGVGKAPDATVAGVMTIDSWNNIGKYAEVTDAFFIFDEQRLVGSGVWVESFLRIAKANRWILLTATPGDVWLDYIPVFLANGFYRNRTEFKREHVVYSHYGKFPKVERYIGQRKLERLRKQILVDMPYQKHTEQIMQKIPVEYDREMFKLARVKRWNMFKNKPIRDIGELYYVMRKVVNSDRSRLAAVRTLMERHPRLIIFYNFDYELEILKELANEVPLAEWNGHRHENIPISERWIYLVQYNSGAEGWNCTETDAVVFYSLTYSYKLFHQSAGRIDRLNTPFYQLYVNVLFSSSWIDRVIWSSLVKKRSFNQYKTDISYRELR